MGDDRGVPPPPGQTMMVATVSGDSSDEEEQATGPLLQDTAGAEEQQGASEPAKTHSVQEGTVYDPRTDPNAKKPASVAKKSLVSRLSFSGRRNSTAALKKKLDEAATSITITVTGSWFASGFANRSLESHKFYLDGESTLFTLRRVIARRLVTENRVDPIIKRMNLYVEDGTLITGGPRDLLRTTAIKQNWWRDGARLRLHMQTDWSILVSVLLASLLLLSLVYLVSPFLAAVLSIPASLVWIGYIAVLLACGVPGPCLIAQGWGNCLYDRPIDCLCWIPRGCGGQGAVGVFRLLLVLVPMLTITLLFVVFPTAGVAGLPSSYLQEPPISVADG